MSFQQIDTDLNATPVNQTTTNAAQSVSRRVGGVTHRYEFFIEGGNDDLVYRKSIDGGVTWGSQVLIKTGTSFLHRQVVVWADFWTPDDTGTLIHILDGVGSGVGNSELRYFVLDMATDTFGTNNDVQINSGASINYGSNGQCDIIKATNGDLFVSTVQDSNVALTIQKSVDAGATWANANSGAIPDSQATFDATKMMPLKGDDDILLIYLDSAASELQFAVYNNVLDVWQGSFTFIESGPESTGGISNTMSATLDKTTGDVYLAYLDALPNTANPDLAFRKFSESTRTWGSKIFIAPTKNGLGFDDINERAGVSLCRHQTDGILMATCLIGQIGGSCTIAFFISSDEGLTWSDSFFIPLLTPIAFRGTRMPTIILDPAEGWYASWVDPPNLDLEGLAETIPLEFFSGTVTDQDTNPIEGAFVTVKQTTPRQICGRGFGKNKPTHGRAISDANGDYKCAVFPLFPSETGTLEYQAQGYEQGSIDRKDRMDLSREDTEV